MDDRKIRPVSIHVPARGTTIPAGKCEELINVSIHVPARGTTETLKRGSLEHSGFNPRSRTGNDYFLMQICYPLHLFQSTFPHGERHTETAQHKDYTGFNPRSRTGNDLHLSINLFQLIPVSIHVPARGTTLCLPPWFAPFTVSIHVPARGTTSCCLSARSPFRCFNPRSRTGNDIRA